MNHAYLQFDEVSRRLQLYLTALWGRFFSIRALDQKEAHTLLRSSLHGEILCLPPTIHGGDGIPAMARYRAAAMHIAAHVIYSGKFDKQGLKPRQRLLIELVEDARIEALAMREFPGLRSLWSSLIPTSVPTARMFPALIGHLSRALFEPEKACHDDFWVNKGVNLFLERQENLENPEISREIGLRLAHDLGQMRLDMDENEPLSLASYRDDNQHLWQTSQNTWEGDDKSTAALRLTDSSENFLEEAAVGLQFAFTERHSTQNDKNKGYRVEVSEQDACLSFNQSSPMDAQTHYVRYPEWFASLGLARTDWCTVRELPAPTMVCEDASRFLAQHGALLKNLRRAMGALRMRRMMRLRAQDSGDELDMDAVIHARVERKMGREPDSRIYQRRRAQTDAKYCTSLLLDLSESVNSPAREGDHPILESARKAALLLGQAVVDLGHPLSVAGFSSNGRHEIDYVRVKGFHDHFDTDVHARLYGLKGGGSTRMGAAIRHAVAALIREKYEHRLLLVVTDGEPADIDVFDTEHLIQDARQAVREARRVGIQVFCVGLDTRSESSVGRIFGTAHHLIIDRVETLPQRLTQLFMRLVSSN